MDAELHLLALKVAQALTARGAMLATAESCTGGWVSQVLTAVAGSSTWFERGFVTYSDAAKRDMLGVRQQTLDADGAVSEAVAQEMAEGALARSGASAALSITGIAGPSGGTPDKPVGMVCFGWAAQGVPAATATLHFKGDREQIRRQAVAHALQRLLQHLPE